MNIVFMGTPQFAVPLLRALASKYSVNAVYTRPDAVSGRGKTLHPSPVKDAAMQLGITVHTPRSFRIRTVDGRYEVHEELVAQLTALAPDFIVVAAYGVILPEEVLAIPRFGCINVHASLLPRWRGAAPIQRAILAGDEELGVSIMRMETGLDTGDYCEVRSTPVLQKTLPQLTGELALLGSEALLVALPAIAEGTAVWIQQDEEQATYAQKIEKTEVRLDPALGADINVRRVRASSAQAPARARVCGKSVAVIEAYDANDVILPVGAVAFIKKHLYLGTVDGAFEIIRIKPEGSKEMSASAFAAGIRGLKGSSTPHSDETPSNTDETASSTMPGSPQVIWEAL